MTPSDLAAVTAAIREGVRAGLEPLVEELRAQRVLGAPPSFDGTPSECSHPEELRMSIGAMGDLEAWECVGCHYQHRVVEEVTR